MCRSIHVQLALRLQPPAGKADLHGVEAERQAAGSIDQSTAELNNAKTLQKPYNDSPTQAFAEFLGKKSASGSS